MKNYLVSAAERTLVLIMFRTYELQITLFIVYRIVVNISYISGAQ